MHLTLTSKKANKHYLYTMPEKASIEKTENTIYETDKIDDNLKIKRMLQKTD